MRRVIVLALIAVMMLGAVPAARVAGAQGEPGTSMFQGNPEHSGQQPGPAPVGLPVQQWAFQTGGAVRSSPTVVDGTVYVGSKDGNLYALDAVSGEERWRFPTGGAIVTAPAVSGGRVYVSSFSGVLHAVDAAQGEPIWQMHTSSASSPVVVDDLVYVGTFDGSLLAINGETGVVRWSATFGLVRSVGTPAIAGQTVFVGGGNEMRAYDKETGRLRWSYAAGAHVTVTPTVAGNSVIFLTATFAEAQAPEDSRDSSDEESSDDPSQPSGAQAQALVTAGTIVALDANSGTINWSFSFTALGLSMSTPAAADGIVYIGTHDGIVRAIDSRTGLERWGSKAGQSISSSPAISDGLIFVGSYDRQLYALSAETGITAWTFPTGGYVHSSPAVVDGMVFVGS
ncbi:MAG: PQQ-binding-like beta-propeller repeat protein, partial [Thermomicrobiales bacterium]